jgi:isocitrate dehydrogenase
MSKSHTITLIQGDGIGPEVTGAARQIIEATGVKINWEVCEAGAQVFKKGLATGVPKETIDSITRNGVALKGPLETPVGHGEKSANVTLRKLFETYGNIRPIREFPGVPTPFSGRHIDFVIVRENVEDLYAGIEHRQTPTVAQCLKLISRPGCEKIIRLAFEFAKSEGRKLVHCATKANIMKETEGLMKRVFEEISQDYPDIEAHHLIVDNCAHQLVKAPEKFDVIVTTNMNGDILSDLGSGLIGGLGFAPGANIGHAVAIFEAVHGSAPKYAGQNTINPTAVLLSGVMMLRHIGEFEAADLIEQALVVTLGLDKIYTRDVHGEAGSVSTTEFTTALIDNFGRVHPDWTKRPYKTVDQASLKKARKPIEVKSRRVAGVDVFIETSIESPEDLEKLGNQLTFIADLSNVKLKLIANRGVKVYPNDHGVQPDLTDCFRCRFVLEDSTRSLDDIEILLLITAVQSVCPWTHVEKLNVFDGVAAYSKAHGED